MIKLFTRYFSNYKGIRREIWILSLITLINRAGAMVIPFLSLYLVNEKGFLLTEVAWIMTAYGLGSLLGNYTGGKLTDLIGFRDTIVLSLFFGGVGFMLLQFIEGFNAICLGVFMLMFAVDIYRPAIFVSADAYSINGNVTQNIGLIRLAINIGYSIGPVIGGYLIAKVGYASIFWVDGITCILASLVLFLLIKPKKTRKKETTASIEKEGISPYKNGLFLLFFLIMVINAIAFVQYFSTIPLFYEQEHGLTEDVIGQIMFINGIMIVFLEMPLINWAERIGISKIAATFWGILFLGLSFFVLNLTHWFGILIIGIIFMTIGEMIGSPFSNALALEMAPKGRKGSYMGLYSMSFSISHIIGHNTGMQLIDRYGYYFTWNATVVMMIVCILLLYVLKRRMENKKLKNV